MNYTKTEICELVCTRISHDLIGNIGALSSALELIEENNNSLDDCSLSILKTASSTLEARQKFFRMAFGLDTKKSDVNTLNSLCLDYLATVGSRSTPITLTLSNISPELTKILCLCVMTAAEVFVRGGHIDITVTDKMKITASSDYALSAGKIATYKEILQNKKPSETVSQYVQLIYLKELLGAEMPIVINSSEKNMEITIG